MIQSMSDITTIACATSDDVSIYDLTTIACATSDELFIYDVTTIACARCYCGDVIYRYLI
jgi:hypothetical protein